MRRHLMDLQYACFKRIELFPRRFALGMLFDRLAFRRVRRSKPGQRVRANRLLVRIAALLLRPY